MASVCIQLERPFTTFLVISTLFTIPAWLRYALVAIFLLSNNTIMIKLSSAPCLNTDRDPAVSPLSRSHPGPAATPQSLAHWFNVIARTLRLALSSALRPALNAPALYPALCPAHSPTQSNQPRDDFRPSRDLHSLNRSIIGPSKRRRLRTKASVVHRRTVRTLPTPALRIPSLRSDEHATENNTPTRYINNPCCHSSHGCSNNAPAAAINQQTDVLRQVLSAVTSPHAPTEPHTVSLSAFMPRPGQPGSLDRFTGANVSDYLDEYNAECELYVVRPEHRTLCLPRYFCTPETKEIITLLPGYESRDWPLLQTEIKKFYWKSDQRKNSLAALNSLVQNSADLPLNAFILKFTSITNALVADNVLTPFMRIIKLLDGLDERMRGKVMKFCVHNSWRVSDEDIGETPNFDEIKAFLDQQVLTMDTISVYERDRLPATSNYADSAISHSPSGTLAEPSPKPSPKPAVPKPAVSTILATPDLLPLASIALGPAPAFVPVVPAPVSLNYPAPTSISAPASTAIPTIPTSSSRRTPRVSRCIWCDSKDHSRRSECALFIAAMKTGNIRINEYGRVVLSSTAAEIPPSFGRGGMKFTYDTVFSVR
jgi:hypothetical protein